MNQTLADLRAIRELILARIQVIRPFTAADLPDGQRLPRERLLEEWEERLLRFDEDLWAAYEVRFTSRMEREK